MPKHKLQKYYMRAKRSINTNNNLSEVKVNDSKGEPEGESKPECSYLSQSDSEIEPVFNSSDSEENVLNSHLNNTTNNTFTTINTESNKTFTGKLREWVVKNRISNVAVNELLKILQEKITDDLPLDSRTLLNTIRDIEVKSVEPGQYYHFGLKNAITNIFANLGSFYTLCKNQVVEINVNVDGLPLSKSSSSQVYPILISLVGHNFVEMVGIYHGFEKPKDCNEFLREFVTEAVDVVNNGFEINDKHIKVKIKAIICDAPAKSYIKNIKGHTGYFSCSKCTIEGAFSNKLYFPEIDITNKRTDTQFRRQENTDHHIGKTILENIPDLDMIHSFPLDYMHLICLGVMKKILLLLCFGKPATKMSSFKISLISKALISLSKDVPIEFNRKPRSLNELKRWKATEFRQILLYTGSIVLKAHLSKDQYKNFLCLHVAVRILSNSRYNHLLDYCEDLLRYFVKTFQILYGVENTSHNVHNLLHITDDVRCHGPLNNFSSFPFENFLQEILKSLRKNEKPLQQIVKRHSERIQVYKIHKTFPLFENPHLNGPILNTDKLYEQFKSITYSTFRLKTSPPDNCCILQNKDIVVISNIIKSSEGYGFICQRYISKDLFYDSPCPSSEIDIFKSKERFLGPLEELNGDDVYCKCIKFHFENDIILMPLLH